MYLEAIPIGACCVTQYTLEVNEKTCVGEIRSDWFWPSQFDVELDLDEGTSVYTFEKEDWFGYSFSLYRRGSKSRASSSSSRRVGWSHSTGILTTSWEVMLPASQRRMTLEYEGLFTTDMVLVYHGRAVARVSERGICCPGYGWAVGSRDLCVEDMVFVGLVFDRIMARHRQNNHSHTVVV